MRQDRTGREPPGVIPCPAVLRVPLACGDEDPAEPVVHVGDRVTPGTRIAAGHGPGSPDVHAPAAGRIAAMERVDTALRADIPAICIDTRGTEQPKGPADTSGADHVEIPRDLAALARIADESGLLDFARAGRSLGDVLREAGNATIREVIINGLCPEPAMTSNKVVLLDAMSAIVAAGAAVREAVNARRCWLAIGRSDRDIVARARKATAGMPVRIATVSDKYPQHDHTLLTLAITGQEVPCGYGPVAIGTLVVEATALAAMADACKGRPLTTRIVTVTGPAAARRGHYRIPVGTAFSDVLTAVGMERPVTKVIDGGLMTGAAVESLDWVTSKRTDAIVLMDRDSLRTPSAGACIRCGWCQEDCPVGLDPQVLLGLYETGRFKEAASCYPRACLECGLCSYICPAELPLAQSVVAMKRPVVRAGPPGAGEA